MVSTQVATSAATSDAKTVHAAPTAARCLVIVEACSDAAASAAQTNDRSANIILCMRNSCQIIGFLAIRSRGTWNLIEDSDRSAWGTSHGTALRAVNPPVGSALQMPRWMRTT